MKKLYRPVGFKEMDLILNTGNRRFPERLPEQPIFYPVLNIEYAREISENWNTKAENSGYVGYVLEFEVDEEYISKFEIQTVGSAIHKELWVPAEELDEFNQHIEGHILIVDAFFGDSYKGESSIKTGLGSTSFTEQFVQLKNLKDFNPVDFTIEVLTQWKIITQNYFIWFSKDFSENGIAASDKENLLNSIRKILTDNKKWFIKN